MKKFTRAGVFAGAIAVCMLGSTALHSSTVSVESKTYLLKVSNVAQAVQLVESVGGSVTDTAASINYLGAALTVDQLNLLSRSGLIVRIAEEQSSAFDGETLAGIWWRKNSRVSGIWWRKNSKTV